MKSVVVFTYQKAIYDRLAAQLTYEGFAVELAQGQQHVVELVREARRDIVIAEARRDHFADFLRNLLRIQPDLLVHLFNDQRVFCHYPMGRQPISLLFAIDNAGLTYPRANSFQPTPPSAESPLVIEV